MATVDTYVLDIKVKGSVDVQKATSDIERFEKAVQDTDKKLAKKFDNFSKSLKQFETGELNKGGGDIKKATFNVEEFDRAVENAGTNIANFNNRLLQLTTGGLALLLTSALRTADEITDLADATGLTAGFVDAFSQSITEAGGKAEDAAKFIRVFYDQIQDLKEGSKTAEVALAKVGITLGDVSALGEQELLQRAIDQLAKMEAGAARTAAGVKIFGKAFAQIDPKTLQQILDTKDIYAMDAALRTVADAAQTLQTNMQMLNRAGIAFLAQFVGSTDQLTITFEQAVDVVRRFLHLIVTLLALKFAEFFLVATRAILGMAVAFGLAGRAAALFQAAATLVGIAIAATVIPLILQLNTEIENAAYNIDKMGKDALNAKQNLEEFAGAVVAVERGLGGAQRAPAGFASLADYFARRREEQADLAQRQAETLSQLAQQIKNVSAQLAKNNKQTLENVANETAYLNMTEDQIEMAQVQQQIYSESMRAIEQLLDIKKGLTAEEQAMIPIIDEQIKKIIKQKSVDQTRATQMVGNLQRIRNAQEDFIKSLEDLNRAFDQQEALTQLQEELDLIGLYGNELDKQNALININRDLRSQMMDLSLQLLQIDEMIAKTKDEQYQKERDRILQQMQDAQMLADARIAAAEREFAKRKELEQSYSEGVKLAMQDIAESFKPINVAQDVVRQGWGRMENALDDFVETGKLNFADLARSIINDITKMILKMLVFKAIEAGLNAIFPGAGTAFSALTGKANGGPVNKNTPYMVGERGPELFVPESAGKIIPNNKVNNTMASNAPAQAPTTNVYNNYYINALDAKSVAQVFAENRKAIFGANKMAEREMSYAGVR